MQENLKAKTVSGMIWSALQRFGTMGISFVSNIVLARLLTPDDYGCIGMLAIFITVSNTFVDGGFGSALIQKKDVTQKDYSTIFWWNLFLSVVLYGVLFISAPAVSRFYNIPLLESVLQVQGIVLIINALNIVQTNHLRKSINFKRLATIHIVSHIIGAVLAIVLAYMGWGVWALVAQQIVASSITSVMLWVMNRWMPSLCFSVESFKQLFSFGGFVLASNLINTFCNNVQGLLIGKFFNPATLGYYTQARKLEEIASHSLSGITDQVSYPVLSKLQSNKYAMISAIRKLLLSLAFITFPLMLILVLVAEPLILFIYGEKWLSCVPYFQILCVAGMAGSLYSVNMRSIEAIGKSKEMFLVTVIKRFVGLSAIVIGLMLYDIKGVMIGIVFNYWFSYFVNITMVSKYVGYKWKQQLKDLLPIVLVSLFAMLLSLFIVKVIGVNLIYFNTLIKLFIFVVVYMIISYIFRLEAYKTVLNIVINIIKRNKN